MNHLQKLAQALIPLNKHTYLDCTQYGREFESQMTGELAKPGWHFLYHNHYFDKICISVSREPLGKHTFISFEITHGQPVLDSFKNRGLSKQEVAKHKKALIKALQKLDVETAQQLADNCQLNQAA